jgi:hypothetical protein
MNCGDSGWVCLNILNVEWIYMSKQKVPTTRIYASITIPMAWLLFLALWLFFYAEKYSIVQNIGVFMASIMVVAVLEVVIWVPWSMKQN